MKPTEKAVIRKIFVCYVYNLFVYVLTAYIVVLTDITIVGNLNLGVTKLIFRIFISLQHHVVNL